MHGPSNLQALLEKRLPQKRVSLLREATTVARDLGLPLYLVGGAVRDLLLDVPVQDMDLVVEGDAARLAHRMADALAGRVLAHSQFRTAKVEVLGERIDVITARAESYRRPGALPTVRPGVILDDLRRRDFTINAMAVRLVPEPSGELLDPLDGRRDLRGGLVRVLHPASFQDDATRILRAVRYEQRLRFRLEPQTEAHLRRDLSMLDTISGQRLRRELQLVFEEAEPLAILARLGTLGVSGALYPPLDHDSAWERESARLRSELANLMPLHCLAWLAYPLSPAEAEGFIARLTMPNLWAAVVRDVVSARQAAPALAGDVSPTVVHERLKGLSLEALEVAVAIEQGRGRIRQNMRKYLDEWRNLRPLLTGRHLVRQGIPQGPQVGKLLDILLEARLEGRVVTRADEEALVRRFLTNL